MISIFLLIVAQVTMTPPVSPPPIVTKTVVKPSVRTSGVAITQDEYGAELRKAYDDPSVIDFPPKFQGIDAHRISNREIRLDLSAPTGDSLCALMRWLPLERELSFWDEFYPQLTDPGAGVTIQRDHERFVYKLGNHGWSSDWTTQSCELLASWILLNANASAPRKRLRSITLSRLPIYWLEPDYLKR